MSSSTCVIDGFVSFAFAVPGLGHKSPDLDAQLKPGREFQVACDYVLSLSDEEKAGTNDERSTVDVVNGANTSGMSLAQAYTERQAINLAKEELSVAKNSLHEYRIDRSKFFRARNRLEKLLPFSPQPDQLVRVAPNQTESKQTLGSSTEQTLLQQIRQVRGRIDQGILRLERLQGELNMELLYLSISA